VYNADFGWGKPLRLRFPLTPLEGLGIILPANYDGGNDGDIEIYFGVHDENFSVLQDDEEWKKYALS